MAIFVPAYGTITALYLVQIFIRHVFSKHGLLESITEREGKSDSRTVPLYLYSHAGKLSRKLQSVKQVVKEELESAIRRFKKYVDGNRTITPDFKPGDKVSLASKNIKTTIPTKKHSERLLGPFEVLKKIASHAYHLKLPLQWKAAFRVFHVSVLEQVKKSSIQNQNQFPPPPVLVEEQE
ncbi:hypothetical protein O181_068125 [Austropuccinia psidii MF-1]|uniref:Tf2-1-like SH3-like domain-containing protein n=1 Tax=Austropuccinia psidii MF-1 TaxID=1389203 RepID=A0A9Q3F0E5_9BASI|nr:hypothetical protein [Austropuccinia psidii MF-1]